MASKQTHRKYSFEHQGNILFFDYNHNHPIMMKSIKFQLGKIRIYTPKGQVYSSVITSNPHLNVVLEWNEQYFSKLFHGLTLFEIQVSTDQDDQDSVYIVVRDHFQKAEEIFLMRVKLTQEFGFDVTEDFWKTFTRFNSEKIRVIEAMMADNRELRARADNDLTDLMRFQQSKEDSKRILEGKMSALLREKQAKLRQFNQNFSFRGMERDVEPSVDLNEQKQSLSMAGSLFEESQEFMFNRE